MQHLGYLLHLISPLNISICVRMVATPIAALNHAIERNWLIGRFVNMTVVPAI